MYGQRIRELRLKHGLTQQQLAEQIGTSQKEISKFETEYLDLSTNTLIKFSKFFKESTDYILGLETDEGKKLYD